VLANTDLVASDATAARIIAAKLMPARWLLAWLPLACSLSAQIFQPLALPAQSSVRDDWQRVPDVMTALSVDVGSRVADVGAGSGYFTVHLSREVGSSGRVIASFNLKIWKTSTSSAARSTIPDSRRDRWTPC
jgi:predicted methyltransferase